MFIVFMRSSLCIYKRGVIHFCSPFLTQKSNSIFSNQLIFTVDVLSWLDGVLVSSCSVSVEMGSCSLVICDSTCLKTHCSINVDGMCSWKCGAAVRALCWSLRFLHPISPPMSACMCLPYMEWLQLRGAWLATGQIVLPVGRFSVHSWFPFFRAPYRSLSALSSCSLARGHTQT